MIVIYLSKQQAIDGDPKSIQRINITGNLDRAGNTTVLFIIEKADKNTLNIPKGALTVL